MNSLINQINTTTITTEKEFLNLYHNYILYFISNPKSNLTIFSLINEYNICKEELSKKGITIKDKFEWVLFGYILSKFKSIGIKNWSNYSKETGIYVSLLLLEIDKTSTKHSKSFKFVFSKSFLTKTHKDILNLIYTFISHYVEIFVNTHQYTKTTIKQTQRIAKSFVKDLINKVESTQMKNNILNIEEFLDTVIEIVLINVESKI